VTADAKATGSSLTAYSPNHRTYNGALAHGSANVSIVSGENSPVTITMQSTIDHLQTLENPLTVTFASETPLCPVAEDAAGTVVLNEADKFTYTDANPGVVRVDLTTASSLRSARARRRSW